MRVDEEATALVRYAVGSGLDIRLASCALWLYFFSKRNYTREKEVKTKEKTCTGNYMSRIRLSITWS